MLLHALRAWVVSCMQDLKSYDQHSFFGTKLRGGQNFLFCYGGRFFQQERVLWGWLTGPSCNQNANIPHPFPH